MKKIFYLVIVLCILFMSINAKAATPRVMVWDYHVKEETVVSGKEFDLSITLKNQASGTVKNLKVTISTENGELLPVQGAGTAYIEELKGGEEQEIVFHMAAAYGLEEKSYPLAIQTEYEGSGIGYTVNEKIFIPVSLAHRLSVTDIYTMENTYEVGDTVEISAVVNNLGAGTLYNVSAEIFGDNLSPNETYVGNVEQGKSGTIDLLTKASTVSTETRKDNRIIINYEDKSGNSYQQEMDLPEITVTTPVYDDFEVVKEGRDLSSIGKIVRYIFLLLVLVLVIILLVRRRRKKKAVLEEF